MANTSEVEALRFVASGAVATVKFLHASRADVQIPTEVLYRSSILEEAISDAGDDIEVYFSLPEGVLDAGMEGPGHWH